MDSISEDYYELLNDELIESKKNSNISEDQRRKYYLDVIWARKEYNDYKKNSLTKSCSSLLNS